ncbi:hypothetical protein QSX85_25820, partial [Escherichia coli]|nr:hypothetical protein [Escherichia coli]MDL5648215.1 hypothetical protein [Escherichia coli]
ARRKIHDVYISSKSATAEEALKRISELYAIEDEIRGLKWSTKTGHRVRVFSSIDFPIRLVVTHHYIRAVLVRC